MKKIYGKFCSRHNEAVNLYKDLHAKDKRFQAFIKVSTHLIPASFYIYLTHQGMLQSCGSFASVVFDCEITSVYFLVCAEDNEQQHCAETQYSRVHFVGHSEDHKISCSHPKDTSAH